MSQNTKEDRRSAHPSRLKPIALLLAGLAIGVSGPLAAADEKSAADLQAELQKANTEIQNLKKELERNRGGIATPQAAPAATAVAAREETVEAAPATQTLDSVVVRSRRQLEKLHDVPVSISVVSGAELDREQASDLEALTKRLGNITFNQNNTRGSSLSIRGLGRRGFTETQDPSVGLIVDGVSYGLSQLGNFDFYDIQSVEVARGPQGTLLGKGASAGVVSITSRAPSFTPSANYELTYGQRETVLIKGAIGGPIIDDLLAWRGSFVVDKQRGAYTVAEDTNRDADTMYNRDRVSARTQFLLTPTADLNAKFSLDIQPRATQLQNGFTEFVQQPQRYANGTLVDSSGTGTQTRLGRGWFQGRNFTYDQLLNSVAREGKVYQNQTQGQTAGTSGASAEVNYNLTDKLTLTSITAHRQYSFQARNDEGTPFDIQKNGGGSVFYKQTSQEFRLAGKPNDFVDYQTGLYFLRTENEVESKNGYGSDAGAWYANNNQYNTLITNAGLNASAGSALLTNSLKDLFRFGQQNINTFSQAIYGQANFHLNDALTVTAGLRIGSERRTTENFADLRNNGVGAALNPVSSRGTALGGFNSIAYSTANVASGTAGNLVNPSAAQLALADSVAQKYFGIASYASLSPVQKAQVAAAKAIRASQIGALITGVRSDYKDQIHSAVLSPKYKFNDNVTAYASWQYGEKSGSALNVNGVATTVKPERTNAYELGVKTFLLDKTLTLNADVYLMDIKDYQQNVVAVDQFATQDNINNNVSNPLAYTSVQGNVPKVQVTGVEVDAAYNGIRYTTLRAAASYNDARYKDFPNAGKPSELAYLSSPFINRSGQRLGEAPYWTVNVSGEYRRPVLNDKVFHASFTTAYIGSTTTDELMSDYSWVPDRATTDLAIGLGHHRGNYDVTLIAKNAFNNNAHEKGWNSYTPYPYPRWFGIVLSGKL